MTEDIQISKANVEEFEQICINIIKVATHLIKIHSIKRKAIQELLNDIVDESEHHVRHPLEHEMEVLEQCLNRELALERAVGSHIQRAEHYFDHFLEPTRHYLKAQANQVFKFKQRVSANKLRKMMENTEDVFRFFLKHLNDWQNRLRKEEEYIKYKSTASLLEVKKLWKKDLDTFWDLKSEVFTLRDDLKTFGLTDRFVSLGGGFAGLSAVAALVGGGPIGLVIMLMVIASGSLISVSNVITAELPNLREEVKIINKNKRELRNHKGSLSANFFSGETEKRHFD